MQPIRATFLVWWWIAAVAQSQHLRVHNKVIVASSRSDGSSAARVGASAQGDGRIIYLQHIHKSGGSTMCRIATLNQMKTSLKTNCNVQADQRCCGNGSDSAEALRAFADSTQYTFVANEGDMYEAMDTERFRYIIVLRKSLSRYISHYKHAYRAFNFQETFSVWWQTQPDNFTFRKICGTRCQNISKYQLSPEIFHYTLARLSKFEDFAFIERFKDSLLQLSRRIGWSKKPSFVQNSDEHDDAFYPHINEQDWDPMMSTLDDALYEYAEQLFDGVATPSFSAETEKRMNDYFAKGPLQACETPCCSPVCSLY